MLAVGVASGGDLEMWHWMRLRTDEWRVRHYGLWAIQRKSKPRLCGRGWYRRPTNETAAILGLSFNPNTLSSGGFHRILILNLHRIQLSPATRLCDCPTAPGYPLTAPPKNQRPRLSTNSKISAWKRIPQSERQIRAQSAKPARCLTNSPGTVNTQRLSVSQMQKHFGRPLT